MIPTMLLLGLALGRWWRVATVAGAVLWPTLLATEGVIGTAGGYAGAAALGAANALVGAALHQAALRLLRAVPARRSARRA